MACAQYDLDVTGKNFGDCRCGHPRAAHSADALKAAPAAAAKKAEAPAAAPAEDYHGPCSSFNVDMTATEFGLCKCGFKKADHGRPREDFIKKPAAPPVPASRAQPPEPAPVAEPETAAPPAPAPASSGRRVSETPCNNYELDITGTFGFCKCGHSREEHKQAGTLKEPELKVFAGGHLQDVKRSTIAPSKTGAPVPQGKQAKPCDNYQVDMQGKTFGDCICGHARAKHKQFQAVKKGNNNDPDEEEEAAPEPAPEPAKVIVRDGTHPCEVFELDIKNQGGYGFCLCGFSRLDHEQFHQDPVEWQRVKDSLTAPKPFT